MRIAVFSVGQHPQTHKSKFFISKNLAALRVRRIEAEWAGKRAIILLPAKRLTNSCPITLRVIAPTKPYIPEKMPPVDLPGIRYVPPKRKIHAFAYGPVSVADAR